MNQDNIGGLRCHDADACAMGQKPCPTPAACGCAPQAQQVEALQYAEKLRGNADAMTQLYAADVIDQLHARVLELEAAQAQHAPLMSDSSKVISDEELERAFAGTNFGTKDYRSVLHVAVLKKACGYYCGHTITQIMKELRLIGASGTPIKRGIEFLRASYHQQMVNGA